MTKKRYTKRKTKKKKEAVELVFKCDQCNKPFNGGEVAEFWTLARTSGSAFTAYDRGLSYIDPCKANNKRKVDKWMFFCCEECLKRFNENIDTI